MTAYRFCRSDDITLLGDALNRCWAPYFPDEPPMTPAAFKRLRKSRSLILRSRARVGSARKTSARKP